MKNIVLSGMPGAGKSTEGVVLAKSMGLSFVDCDLVIQEQTGMLLHELIAKEGAEGFRQLENRILTELSAKHSVIATGGSAVYGKEAMRHLRNIGTTVYLELSFEAIEDRLGDLKERGVLMRPGQTLRDIYDERVPLYQRYADYTINCENKRIREIVSGISARLS